ncbi:hypothetical protein Q8A67_000081 [Cirrhinus molitorella]|uniref:Uncharacterized protein n=1 Tax=Cirrhinus molitorella TaxID=172907 RepID=A0AA88QC19_9TELE|nr:hypothetical protein Q8A67_000081 [Cirrhinus molitorella]
MSGSDCSSSDNEQDAPQQDTSSKTPPSAGSKEHRPGSSVEPQVSAHRRRPAKSAPPTRRRRSPPPSRPQSPASSHTLASPSVPPIGKWTVAGLRQALSNAEIKFSRKMSKSKLYDLYVSLGKNASPTSKKVAKPCKSRSHVSTSSFSSRSSSSSPRATTRNKPSASMGRAPDSAASLQAPPPSSFQPITAVLPADAPHTGALAGVTHQPSLLPTPFLPPQAADASVRMPPSAAQVQLPFYYPSSTPFSYQWPAAPAADIRGGYYQSAPQSSVPPPFFPSTSSYRLPQAPEPIPCALPSGTAEVQLPSEATRVPPSIASIRLAYLASDGALPSGAAEPQLASVAGGAIHLPFELNRTLWRMGLSFLVQQSCGSLR